MRIEKIFLNSGNTSDFEKQLIFENFFFPDLFSRSILNAKIRDWSDPESDTATYRY